MSIRTKGQKKKKLKLCFCVYVCVTFFLHLKAFTILVVPLFRLFLSCNFLFPCIFSYSYLLNIYFPWNLSVKCFYGDSLYLTVHAVRTLQPRVGKVWAKRLEEIVRNHRNCKHFIVSWMAQQPRQHSFPADAAAITSRHVTSRHVTSRHVASRCVTSRHVASRRVTSRHVASHHIASHNIT